VQGKVEWVKNEEERTSFLQQTVDHTKKYQDLSEEKKGFEEEKKKAVGDIEGIAEKQSVMMESLNTLSKIIYKNPDVQEAIKESEKEAGTRELTEDEILQSYGIETDDLTVDDFTKKLALDNYAIKQGQKKSDDRFVEEKRKTDFIVLKDFSIGIVKVANEAKKQYPYEDVMGEDGNGNPINKTAVYFTEQMVSRIEAQKGKPENERTQAGDIAVGLVKEIHEMQKGTTSSKEGMVDISSLTLDQIKEARPELFGGKPKGNDKGEKTVTDQSSTEETHKEKSAPSLRTENREKVDIQHYIKSKGEGQPRFMTTEEAMDAAFGTKDQAGEIDFDAED
jgi:hypothetical protein